MAHKHEDIARELRTEIAAGQYDAGGRLPSEAQLVERFSVSRPTAARALRDLQAEGLIERRAGAGSFLRKTPPRTEPRVLGLMVPGRGSTEILEAICGELGALARLHSYGLLWGRSGNPLLERTLDAQLAEEVCRQYVERPVSGVFFAPFEHLPDREAVNSRLLDLLRQGGIPVVLLDRDARPFPQRSDYDLISIDHFLAGYLAATHLMRLGKTPMKFLCEPGSAPTIDARIAGVREAIVSDRQPLPKGLRVEGRAEDARFVKSAFGDRRTRGVICGNDFTAYRLLQTLKTLGVRVPDDLAIVGFDDVRYATFVTVGLTTLRQPCKELAHVAFRVMEARMQGSVDAATAHLLSPTLVVRDSCGAYVRTPERK